MKSIYTKMGLSFGIAGALITILFLSAFLSLNGCSSEIEKKDNTNQINYSGDKSFSFKENGSDWKVDFDKNDIVAVYKDGVRISDDEIEKHKEMIYDKINELRSDPDSFVVKKHRFYFDGDEFKEQMKKFKDDFDKDNFLHFNLKFNEDELEKNLRKLEENLKELKDKKIELYFDSEEFKDNMKELEENLKNLPAPPDPPDIDVDVYIDMNKFKENMKKFGQEFKLHNFRIDSSFVDMKNLHKDIKELKNNLKGLKIEIHDLKGEMKKHKAFLDELKPVLVKDGYLDSVDEELDLEMNANSTEVNGTKVKDSDHLKYKEIYKKYFDKDIDGTFKIKSD